MKCCSLLSTDTQSKLPHTQSSLGVGGASGAPGPSGAPGGGSRLSLERFKQRSGDGGSLHQLERALLAAAGKQLQTAPLPVSHAGTRQTHSARGAFHNERQHGVALCSVPQTPALPCSPAASRRPQCHGNRAAAAAAALSFSY